MGLSKAERGRKPIVVQEAYFVVPLRLVPFPRSRNYFKLL